MASGFRGFASKWLKPSMPSYFGIVGRPALSFYYGSLTLSAAIMAPWSLMAFDAPGSTKNPLIWGAVTYIWSLPIIFGAGSVGSILGMRGCYYFPALQLAIMAATAPRVTLTIHRTAFPYLNPGISYIFGDNDLHGSLYPKGSVFETRQMTDNGDELRTLKDTEGNILQQTIIRTEKQENGDYIMTEYDMDNKVIKREVVKGVNE